MTKEDKEDFKNFIKCWICGNNDVHTDMEVSDHCHITGKYRGSAQRDWNINLKSNHKIPVLFHNLKILGLSKALMDKFYYDYIKNMTKKIYYSEIGIASMYQIITEDVYDNFSIDKGMFGFSNYSTKSRYSNDWKS